ncbi:MAG: biotin/lipoyl-binding protein [Nitrososphaerota archaeon]|nr:biotin/lipoyl-binding protein [Nitrososphaerota archaeon]MDG6938895.1 biotin/lipoyl-binding protein [Nitrososphaerota archaeon]
MTRYELSVGGRRFSVDVEGGGGRMSVRVDGVRYAAAVKSVEGDGAVITVDGKDLRVEIVEEGPSALRIRVDGEELELGTVSGRPGAERSASGGLHSPLPGRVVSVLAEEGKTVSAGDQLVVIESMKMETAIRSDVDGRVAKVHVRPGDTVKRGQALVSFEPVSSGL